MKKNDISQLMEKAKAATPGPWVRLGSSTDSYNFLLWYRDDFYSCGVPDIKICQVYGENPTRTKEVNIGQPGHCFVPDDDREHNIQFIAAANPQVVLDICERVIGLSEALEYYSDREEWIDYKAFGLASNGEFCRVDSKFDHDAHGETARHALERFGVK